MKFTAGPLSFWETVAFDPMSIAGAVAAPIIGGLISGGSASDAAGVQADAANKASANTMAMYNQTRQDLAPYNIGGQNALTTLTGQLPYLTSAFNPTQASLEATPGYQFNLSQGLQGVQNSAAAKGLGISGAALKGAANYATGLADNTLQTQFNIDQANKTNAFNKLLGLTQTGANAAAQTGQLGTTAAQNSGNFLTSGANAQAAGMIGGANALTGGLNNAANTYLTSQLLQGGY